MRPMRELLLFLVLAATAAQAASPGPPVVLVTGTRIALDWPYAVLEAGMAAFEEERALAPQAALRFRLLLSPGVTILDNVALTLVDGDSLVPVPVTPAGLFQLDHMRRSAGASLAVNRNGGQFDGNRTPQPDVRTPGLPDHVRRLGDLRLECRVKMAMAKAVLGFLQSIAISALGGSDWCAPRKGGGYSVDTKLAAPQATLSHGNRTLVLPARGRGSVTMPIADPAWADNALVTFAQAAPQALPQAPQ